MQALNDHLTKHIDELDQHVSARPTPPRCSSMRSPTSCCTSGAAIDWRKNRARTVAPWCALSLRDVMGVGRQVRRRPSRWLWFNLGLEESVDLELQTQEAGDPRRRDREEWKRGVRDIEIEAFILAAK